MTVLHRIVRSKQKGAPWAAALGLAFAAFALWPNPAFAAAAGASAAGNDGRTCTVADRDSATWFGFFNGGRNVFAPLKDNVTTPGQARWRCFDTEADCLLWMEGMKNTHAATANGRPIEAFCRQGG
jgi:hypothetical protein